MKCLICGEELYAGEDELIWHVYECHLLDPWNDEVPPTMGRARSTAATWCWCGFDCIDLNRCKAHMKNRGGPMAHWAECMLCREEVFFDPPF